MTIEVETIPACPLCGAKDWLYWEGGNYRSEHLVEEDGAGAGVIFRRWDHDEDAESSEFWCRGCDLGNPWPRLGTRLEPTLTTEQADAWDAVRDQLYELRDIADWRVGAE